MKISEERERGCNTEGGCGRPVGSRLISSIPATVYRIRTDDIKEINEDSYLQILFGAYRDESTKYIVLKYVISYLSLIAG